MTRVIIHLKQLEKDALFKLAEFEYRNPREQAALIIRGELERRGYLTVVNKPETAVTIQSHDTGIRHAINNDN